MLDYDPGAMPIDDPTKKIKKYQIHYLNYLHDFFDKTDIKIYIHLYLKNVSKILNYNKQIFDNNEQLVRRVVDGTMNDVCASYMKSLFDSYGIPISHIDYIDYIDMIHMLPESDKFILNNPLQSTMYHSD